MKSLTSLTPNLDIVSSFIKPEYVPDLTTTVGKLKHLRHVVERIPPERLRMDLIVEQTECGTFGCMLGWAAQDQLFQEAGLRTEGNYCGSVLLWRGEWKGFRDAGHKLFGITEFESFDLFSISYQAGEPIDTKDFTISHGLARIDRIIEKYSGQ